MIFTLFACITEFPTDLSLIDVNTTSPTYQESHVLDNYEGRVSVWYFGHSS